jgi:hypothetical protein
MHGLHERRFQTTPNEHFFLILFFQLENLFQNGIYIF